MKDSNKDISYGIEEEKHTIGCYRTYPWIRKHQGGSERALSRYIYLSNGLPVVQSEYIIETCGRC